MTITTQKSHSEPKSKKLGLKTLPHAPPATTIITAEDDMTIHRRNFQPKNRGDITKALAQPTALTVIAPESPRPLELLDRKSVV